MAQIVVLYNKHLSRVKTSLKISPLNQESPKKNHLTKPGRQGLRSGPTRARAQKEFITQLLIMAAVKTRHLPRACSPLQQIQYYAKIYINKIGM